MPTSTPLPASPSLDKEKKKHLTDVSDLKREMKDLQLDISGFGNSWLQIPNEILSFVQSSDKERIEKLQAILTKRNERLTMRKEGFEMLTKLVNQMTNFPPRSRDLLIMLLYLVPQGNSSLFNFSNKLEVINFLCEKFNQVTSRDVLLLHCGR